MMQILRKAVLKVSAGCYNRHFRKRNKQNHVTFVSQNCIGGVLYHMLGIPFSSPTINMFIEDENFVKLAERPEHYFSLDAEPYEEAHVDQVGEDRLVYPIIRVDDILLCCQHFKNCREAVEAWNKRRLRVNYDRLFVIACSWNLSEREDLVKRVNDLPCPVVIFTTEDYHLPHCVKLQGSKWFKDCRGAVQPHLTSFEGLSGKRYFSDVFDFVKWINEG